LRGSEKSAAAHELPDHLRLDERATDENKVSLRRETGICSGGLLSLSPVVGFSEPTLPRSLPFIEATVTSD